MAYGKVANGLNFFKSKLPFLAKKINLRSDKTYIVPSGFGFAFSLLAIVLLALAINSGNNLIYFFAFFLISMALTGMLITNQNIEAVAVIEIQPSFIFANEENQLAVLVKNKERTRDLWDITIQIIEDGKASMTDSFMEGLAAFKTEVLAVAYRPEHRGFKKIPRLKIQSRFPFGMLTAWKYFEQQNQVFIFPQRAGQIHIPLHAGAADQHEADSAPDTKGYFRDFRDYQKTDSPNRIDWKRSLKHQKHLVKNYEAEGEKKILIDWDLAPAELTFEQRISQLALWIDLSHRRNELYSLKIKNQETDFDSGWTHYRRCLEKLALLRLEDTV